MNDPYALMADAMRGQDPRAPRRGLEALADWLPTTWPARGLAALAGAATLPTDAAYGVVPAYEFANPRLMSDATFERAQGLAGLGMSGTFGMRSGGLRARVQHGHDAPQTPLSPPPAKPQRPFDADYPGYAGRPGAALTHDIDGRPLRAEYLAGRREVGGPDVGLDAAAIDAITARVTGQLAQNVARQELSRNTLGHYGVRQGPNGLERAVFVADDLPPAQAAHVTTHELGHALNDLAGRIPDGRYLSRIDPRGVQNDLGRVFNDLNTPPSDWRLRTQERTGIPVAPRYRISPETMGYPRQDWPSEYMAEAIRAYLQDPNYLKTVAPDVAARLRAAVNAHPTLSKIIQLNSGDAPAIPIGQALLAERYRTGGAF